MTEAVSDEQYKNADPFFGDESEIKCRTVEIRKARKAYICWGLDGKMDHAIQIGERHRYERALVDGRFGEYRLCLRCMDKFIGGRY